MAKRSPKPFKYRGNWRAQVTVAGGKKLTHDFVRHADAVQWIHEQCALLANAQAPALGGPTQTTLAQALHEYAHLYTLVKGGAPAELTRINHYLVGGGLAPLCLVTGPGATRALEPKFQGTLPSAFAAHRAARHSAREKTYATIHALGARRCSTLKVVDFRDLMTTMKAEGLSDSTIQKEIALLRHLFNVAAKEWAWSGFANPTAGLKLGRSEVRFVVLSEAQRQALARALDECDNPYFKPLVALAVATTMRRRSLLTMTWDQVDLEGRVARVNTKTGPQVIPLSPSALETFRALPRSPSGRVFPLTETAVDCAWDGVRCKAGVPTLQFRDLRHVGATMYARAGFSPAQLKRVLGHSTESMAAVYVNLVSCDIVDAMEVAGNENPVVQVTEALPASPDEHVRLRRSERLARAVKAKRAERLAREQVGAPSSDVSVGAHPVCVPEPASLPAAAPARRPFEPAASGPGYDRGVAVTPDAAPLHRGPGSNVLVFPRRPRAA